MEQRTLIVMRVSALEQFDEIRFVVRLVRTQKCQKMPSVSFVLIRAQHKES